MVHHAACCFRGTDHPAAPEPVCHFDTGAEKTGGDSWTEVVHAAEAFETTAGRGRSAIRAYRCFGAHSAVDDAGAQEWFPWALQIRPGRRNTTLTMRNYERQVARCATMAHDQLFIYSESYSPNLANRRRSWTLR